MSVKPKLPAKGSSAGIPTPGVLGMNSTHNDIGEKSGFEASTDSYIVKKGTPYGEGAKFNHMPPGMDISNQENADIRDMPMKRVTAQSFPGDGWEPTPRDISE